MARKHYFYIFLYLLSCLTIFPIFKYWKWSKHLKKIVSTIEQINGEILLFCQLHRSNILEILPFFWTKKNKLNYVNTISKKYFNFEINFTNIKQFLDLQAIIDVVVCNFFKLEPKILESYSLENQFFNENLEIYNGSINSIISQIKFDYKFWPKKLLYKSFQDKFKSNFFGCINYI